MLPVSWKSSTEHDDNTHHIGVLFMTETTTAKTAYAAELLAASLMIQQLCKEAYIVENLEEHRLKLELLASIVTSTFSPAEA